MKSDFKSTPLRQDLITNQPDDDFPRLIFSAFNTLSASISSLYIDSKGTFPKRD